METQKVLGEVRHHIRAVISQKSEIGVTLWNKFLKLHPADIAQFLSEIHTDDFHELALQLPPSKMASIFPLFSEVSQRKALAALDDMGRVDALNSLTTDEMTDLFEHLSDEELRKYLSLLHKKDREAVLSLLKFESDSAGGIMETEVFVLYEDNTVKKSIELIQRLEIKQELHGVIFVINTKKQLVGHIHLEDLVFHKPLTVIKTFVRESRLIVRADEDQESIAKRMVHYQYMIVPVVGDDNFFLGVIPSSTLVDVLEEEASEDVYRMSAMEPVRGHYFEMPFLKLLYQRSYILIILLLAQSVSSVIINHHQGLLAGFLVMFITMLISTGGNASSQTSAVIIQGMASGEINEYNAFRFFKREFSLAIAMALILGITAFGRVYFTSSNLWGSFAVSVSLACIVVVSMSIGSIIPVLFKRYGIDPAYAAGPVLATLMDILGLLIFCNVSKLFIFS